MKKLYVKPVFEIEKYELNSSIAANCQNTVNVGPEAPGHVQCSDFDDSMGVFAARAVSNVNFYEDTGCECYYTADNGRFWTS